MKQSRSRNARRLVPALIAAGLTAALLPAAQAATTVLDTDIELVGTQPLVNTWDPDGSGSADLISDAYQPVSDGSLFETDGDERSDAFDDGLMLRVGGSDYDPENAGGDTIGNFFDSPFGPGVRTPTRGLENLRVSRTDVVRAKGSATMRNLVKLRNTTNSARTRDITWESDLGSDGSTELIRTSSGDADQTPGDRWIVTSDSLTSPGDPVVTHVFSGKGAAKKVTTINSEPGGAGNVANVSVTLDNVRVPKKSTRFLLFFAEMSVSNQGAVNAAKKYNRNRKVKRQLLGGLSKRVRKQIVNWDF